MFSEADSPPYVHHSVPNRSLGAAAFGAWPVMPFAGLEIALVLLAFHLVRLHDALPLGRLLSDEGRRRLAEELRGRIAVTAN